MESKRTKKKVLIVNIRKRNMVQLCGIFRLFFSVHGKCIVLRGQTNILSPWKLPSWWTKQQPAILINRMPRGSKAPLSTSVNFSCIKKEIIIFSIHSIYCIYLCFVRSKQSLFPTPPVISQCHLIIRKI